MNSKMSTLDRVTADGTPREYSAQARLGGDLELRNRHTAVGGGTEGDERHVVTNGESRETT